MIFGFALLAPTLVRPLSGLIGRPLARFQGLTGMLARENTRRQPQRTAVTASALMIGVALVVLVAIFAAGLRATIDQGIDEQVKAVGIVTHEDGFSPLPAGIAGEIEQVDGVTAVSRIRFATGRVVGETGNTTVTGIDPDTVRDVLKLKWSEGSDAVLSGLGTTAWPSRKEFADKHDLKVGSELRADGAARQRGRLHGQGHLRARRAGVIGGVLAPQRLARGRLGRQGHRVRARRGAPGADPRRSRRARRRRWPASRPPSRRRSRTSRTSRTSRSTRSSASSTRCCRCR